VSGAQQLSDEIGKHIWWWFGLKPRPPVGISALLDVDTIYMTALVMIVLLGLALLARRNLSLQRPTGVQNLLEMVMEFVNGFVTDSLGAARGVVVAPLAITLFMFIFISNYIGLVPVPAIRLGSAANAPELPAWHSPTNDVNTTVGLALMVVVYIQWAAIKAHGGIGGWLRHTFLSHGAGFAPLALIEEITRPISLSMRLFGNIFAGEVLILVFSLLLPAWAVPLPYLFALFLGLFVGLIQAFVFTILTVAYIGIATNTEDAH